MNSLMDYILNPRGQSAAAQAASQNISDEESLEDHSGLEDFRGVTLQLDENDTSASRSPTPGTPYGFPGTVSDSTRNAKYEAERLALFGVITLDDKREDAGGSLPLIAITPMTPPSGLMSPDANSTISLNSSAPSPSPYKQIYQQGDHSSINKYWRPSSPTAAGTTATEDEGKDFFAYRDTIMQNVMDEVQKLRDVKMDGDVRGTWLLTEIDHWDNEKERIVMLCTKSIIIVKYDFIGMKEEEHRRIFLCIVDTIIQGELKYPERSLTPRISGIAGGLVGVVKDCIIPRVHGTVSNVGSAVLYRNNAKQTASPTSPEVVEATEFAVGNGHENPGSDGNGQKTSIMSALSLDNFEPRIRNVQGIRIMWNQDLPLSFTQKWNPFNKSIPWLTFTSHPLLWHKGGGERPNRCFDVDSFAREFIDILSHSGGDTSPVCRVEYKPIIIETYVGLTSLFHNANSLGFYKVRGKVSF